jgi:glycosyltransferase involved in cell wall biosynthesis
MRIAMISDYETQGGAAVAASHLASGLVQHGHEVVRIVAERGTPDGWTTEQLTLGRLPLPTLVMQKITGRQPQIGTLRQCMSSRLGEMLNRVKPDVINVHNIHGMSERGWFVDLIAQCRSVAPTFWTLHDMWSFTGRCTYAYDCERFVSGCNAECPTHNEYPALPAPRVELEWETRRRFFAGSGFLAAVTPSQWMADQANRGLWRSRPVHVIPNGLCHDQFAPIDRRIAREALRLPTRGPILLATAVDWNERRKGGAILAQALPLVRHRPLTIAFAGGGLLPNISSNINVVNLKYLVDDRIKAMAYSAADLFVHPAPVDNLPNVVMEAMACGTPTAAFAIGGIPEMVREGQTGWLANDLNAVRLAATIDHALDEISIGKTYRTECREVAEAEYSQSLQAQRYAELFENLNKPSPARVAEVVA